jgi:hypothetical protein
MADYKGVRENMRRYSADGRFIILDDGFLMPRRAIGISPYMVHINEASKKRFNKLLEEIKNSETKNIKSFDDLLNHLWYDIPSITELYRRKEYNRLTKMFFYTNFQILLFKLEKNFGYNNSIRLIVNKTLKEDFARYNPIVKPSIFFD